MTRRAIVLLGIVTACGHAAGGASPGDAGSAGEAGADAGPSACGGDVPPSTLECAGLYSDFATKTIAPTMHAYAPAVPLWSDGAEKQRWIELPAGKKIDASDPDEWVFPVGTKVFKQFSYGGRRVETRLFQKVAQNEWVHATYAWNASETATQISYGESVATADGGSWLIPSPGDCDSCHHGRSDRILGFEAVNLGLPGASGMPLSRLAAESLLDPPPPLGALSIGDDGTGLDAPALAWLHVNCGVTCHNANEGATAYGAGMRLRLDPRWLDGSTPDSSWDPLRTTLGVACTSGSVAGQPRIAPGDPGDSVIMQLISQRGALQMPPPPLSRFVDTPDVAAVRAWIEKLPGGPDAGSDAGNDAAGGDATAGDATATDATAGDASAGDAAESDAAGSDAAGSEGGEDAAADSQSDDAGPDASADADAEPLDGGAGDAGDASLD